MRANPRLGRQGHEGDVVLLLNLCISERLPSSPRNQLLNDLAPSSLPPAYPRFSTMLSSELFLERFATQAFDHAEKLGRKTIKYRDVSDIRVKDPNLLFLEAVVPP